MENKSLSKSRPLKSSSMANIALMTSLMCIFGPLSIPIGLVPLSLITLVIFLSLYILGMKKGTLSLLLYILIGFSGLPVFSSFSSGPSQLLGPTGGYLIGFIFMALISGFFIENFQNKWFLCFVGMILGSLACYVFGTLWLAHQTQMPLASALTIAVFPFIPGDLAKLLFASYLGPKLRKQLSRSGLLVS